MKTLTMEEYIKKYPNPQRGPCVHCGGFNYNLSMGGPAVCPACDIGKNPNCEKCKVLMKMMENLEKAHPEIKGVPVNI